MPKQAEAKWDGEIISFKHGKFLCFKTLRINQSQSKSLATCALGTLGQDKYTILIRI